jgi:hypothetical protein
MFMEMRRRWWAPVVTLLALAASAPPAPAAFPGGNGRLVLTPMSGGGVLIASPRTGGARRVCDRSRTCDGRTEDARFSPNGREVVFGARGDRLEVTTVTGTCVWCPTSLPPVTIHGRNPVFTPGGTAITYVHKGVWEVAPGRPTATRLRVIYGPVLASDARVSAVAWGPSRKVVAVCRG